MRLWPNRTPPLGFGLQHFDFDLASAERAFGLCIQLSPGYSIGHMWYGACLGAAARFEASFAEARLAVQLDPLSDHRTVGRGSLFRFRAQV